MASHQSDVFAPPTTEELNGLSSNDVFSPPTAEEMKSFGGMNKNRSIDPDAALAGYGQGSLLGFEPEVSAATEPAFTKAADFITGQNVYDSLPDYQSRKDQETTRLKHLQAESPGSFAGGETAGLIAPTLEGVGVAGSVAKKVGTKTMSGAVKAIEKVSQSGLLRGTNIGAVADLIAKTARGSSKLKGLLPEAEAVGTEALGSKTVYDPFLKKTVGGEAASPSSKKFIDPFTVRKRPEPWQKKVSDK